MKRISIVLVCLLMLSCDVWAQDNQPAQETITVPKSEFEALKQKVDQLAAEIQALKAAQAPVQPAEQTTPSEPDTTAPAPETPPASEEPAPTSGAGGKQLALPDISLVVQAEGLGTNDPRNANGQKLLLTEAEIGIQGYVYPNVKADAFIAMSPADNEPAQVEEAYLTYLGLFKGLNAYIGQKHVAFGRTNLLHNHSWPYTRQPLAITNLIAAESLTGQGVSESYVIPTHSNLFAELDLGYWANGEEGEQTDLPDIVVGPGANLTDRFGTARLWTSYPTSENSELELGGSWAGGNSNPEPLPGTDHVDLAGVDLSYRHFGESNKRLLLRGESFWRRGSTDSDGLLATGYYLFGQYRWNKYDSVGMLYDWSEFPQAATLHESALSLILTKQFSEQYYLRLQAIHGARPDDPNYDEVWLQWCWGLGPHTHNLE
jgi:hypothetical protein